VTAVLLGEIQQLDGKRSGSGGGGGEGRRWDQQVIAKLAKISGFAKARQAGQRTLMLAGRGRTSFWNFERARKKQKKGRRGRDFEQPIAPYEVP